MKASQILYFLILGTFFGFVILSLEIRVISETPLDWEATSVFELFLSGMPWYLVTHLIMSLVIAGLFLAGSKILEGFNKRISTNQFWPIWGLSLLLFLDLLFFFGSIFAERLFNNSFSTQLWMWMILIGIISLMTLIPCVLISFFLGHRRGLGVGLQLLLISAISFVTITWLHRKEIVVTEHTPLITNVPTLETLHWLLEGLLLGGLALILIIIVSWFLKRLRLLGLPDGSLSLKLMPMLFLAVLTTLTWVWMSISKSDKVAQAKVVSPVVTPSTNSPNIIVIVVDTLGGKYVDSNNLEQYPGFVQLTKDGFHFDHAYATASNTAWSVPAILTSNFRFVDSKRQFGDFGWLNDDAITTAEMLKSKGYETVGFSANPVISKTFNYDRGFDYFSEPNSTRLFIFNLLKSFSEVLPRFAYQYGLVDHGTYYEDIKELYSKMENYLTRKHSRPFYLFVQTMDMHGPYLPPKHYLDDGFTFDKFLPYSSMVKQKYNGTTEQVPDDIRNNTLKLYLGELKYTDEYIGLLIQLLKKLNLHDNTLIIVTADHGEEFWEHGSVIHSHTLYNELIRVPLFVKPPDSANQNQRFSRGIIIKTDVSTLDILPTILDFAGADFGPSKENIKGKSLIPLMLGEINETENRIHYGVMMNQYYAMQNGWKLIWDKNSRKFELYDLNDDPLEKRNLFSLRHPMFQNLSPYLKRFAQSFKNRRKGQEDSPNLPLKLKEELRSLGYIE